MTKSYNFKIFKSYKLWLFILNHNTWTLKNPIKISHTNLCFKIKTQNNIWNKKYKNNKNLKVILTKVYLKILISLFKKKGYFKKI